MKRKIVSLFTLLAATVGLAACGSIKPVKPDVVKTITIDGGGDIADFTSTPSMTKSETNPYPYNTLETLCREWEELNPGYKVKINKTSSKGDRSILVPQLKSKTACNIIYQNGSVKNTDLGQDYYVDLTPYLDGQNKYLGGNAKWSSVYNQGELATTQASDGKYYYVNLEKIPVCFMYNKTLLSEAGVTNPESILTFKQLLQAMDQVETYLNTKDDSYATYSTTYTWYQIAMESNMFSHLIEPGDVLRKNNMIDTEEMCRLYTKELFKPQAGISSDYNADTSTFENNIYYEYIKLINQLDQYKAPATYAAQQGWLSGRLAFLEATGAQLRTNYAQTTFDWGTISYPDITVDSSSYAGKGVVRGSAGLATSWWISNSAVKDDVVEGCVDLLKFLTAPKQNNRLIGDLKGGIPLNPTADYELAPYLNPLVDQYNKDILDANQGKRVYWGSFNSWDVLGISYSNQFIRTMQEMDAGTTTPEKATALLAKSIKNTVTSYMVEYEYNTDLW